MKRTLGISQASRTGDIHSPRHPEGELMMSDRSPSRDVGNRVYQFFKKWFPRTAEERYGKYLTREGCYGMSEEDQ